MSIDPTAKGPPNGYAYCGQLGRTFQLDGALRWHVAAALAEAAGAPAGGTKRPPLALRAVGAAGVVFVTGLGEVRVRAARLASPGGPPLLMLEGVRDRTAAQRLVNAEVWLDPARLSGDLAAELELALATPDEEGALVGLPVLLEGLVVGEVSGADLSGPNAVARVALAAGGGALIPLAAPYVRVTEEAVVLTDPPAGLLDAG
ncbi:MAG: hypothetical protein KF875_08950 [Trueperaceae bacterium]|nr:hypothetical protein [Trueperaceae bacterium]MCC6310186.1 hypothetical protein [Trueperaceae bacterium]MCO5175092.1 hypothetical protein [Trueperaceae bacterium]